MSVAKRRPAAPRAGVVTAAVAVASGSFMPEPPIQFDHREVLLVVDVLASRYAVHIASDLAGSDRQAMRPFDPNEIPVLEVALDPALDVIEDVLDELPMTLTLTVCQPIEDLVRCHTSPSTRLGQ
jgi:hypothetical protein